MHVQMYKGSGLVCVTRSLHFQGSQLLGAGHMRIHGVMLTIKHLPITVAERPQMVPSSISSNRPQASMWASIYFIC